MFSSPVVNRRRLCVAVRAMTAHVGAAVIYLSRDATGATISHRISGASLQVFSISVQYPTFSTVMLFKPDEALLCFSKNTHATHYPPLI